MTIDLVKILYLSEFVSTQSLCLTLMDWDNCFENSLISFFIIHQPNLRILFTSVLEPCSNKHN